LAKIFPKVLWRLTISTSRKCNSEIQRLPCILKWNNKKENKKTKTQRTQGSQMLTELLASKLTQQLPKLWPNPLFPDRPSSSHLSHTLVMIPESFPHQKTHAIFPVSQPLKQTLCLFSLLQIFSTIPSLCSLSSTFTPIYSFDPFLSVEAHFVSSSNACTLLRYLIAFFQFF